MPGSGFSFGRGLGVALVVAKTTEAPLKLPAKSLAELVRVKQVNRAIRGKPLNKDSPSIDSAPYRLCALRGAVIGTAPRYGDIAR
jgi:hypothetical protein